MKAWVSIVLVLAALVLVAFVLLRYPAFHRPVETATRPETRPASGPVAGARTPTEAVVTYVEALNRKDYRAAWEGLSQESQATHPYEEFVERAETGQSTDLDLAAASEGKEHEGQVIVTVPVVEDPAEAGFTTVGEAGGWKVVYIGGEPWFPYSTPGSEVAGSGEGEKGRAGD